MPLIESNHHRDGQIHIHHEADIAVFLLDLRRSSFRLIRPHNLRRRGRVPTHSLRIPKGHGGDKRPPCRRISAYVEGETNAKKLLRSYLISHAFRRFQFPQGTLTNFFSSIHWNHPPQFCLQRVWIFTSKIFR